MPRGYRCIVVAAFGLALIGAAPQPNSNNASETANAQNEPTQRAPAIAPPPAKAIEKPDRPVLTSPCDPGDDRRQSDLCAQWKAADAARDTAWWAMFGSIVAIIGTIGLYWQIRLTREAVQDTGEATEAMREANAIAADAQRPWIDISLKVERLVTTEKTIKLHYKVAFKNIGQSVATNVWTNVKVDCFGSKAGLKIQSLRDHWWGENKGPSTVSLMPGEQWEHEATMSLAKVAVEWTSGTPRMMSLGALASAFYNLSGKPDYAERRRTDRYFRVGMWNEDPILSYFILEEDVRDVRAVEINVIKSKNTITT